VQVVKGEIGFFYAAYNNGKGFRPHIFKCPLLITAGNPTTPRGGAIYFRLEDCGCYNGFCKICSGAGFAVRLYVLYNV